MTEKTEREEKRFPDSYVVVDLETTGLSPREDHILEIGAVKVRDGKVTDTYAVFVDPGCPIPEPIRNLTGITDEMVRGQRTAAQALEEFLAFCKGDDLMGHNLPFDYGFLKQQAVIQHLPFEKRGIDTLKIARCLLDGLSSRSLTSLCDYFHIDRSRAHRALHDALATHQLYQCLQKTAGEEARGLFEPAPLFYRAKKISPITDSQKRYLKDLAKYHRIELDVEIDSLTKSEASRQIDRIIMNYGRIMR
ncbi:MAG TPA: 3'-5' exoribonuclease [Candidatus Pullilachnospira intestinigallinarum]|mgnify:CR=1 FL=1|nr:3'-5' exoribonuclease [Candidatus Pullilachnospira intestinigallinarum]